MSDPRSYLLRRRPAVGCLRDPKTEKVRIHSGGIVWELSGTWMEPVGLEPIDWKSYGLTFVAGVDEAGRGCLAGPVFAASVVLGPDFELKGLTDSKLLTPEQRTEFAEIVKEKAICWSVGIGSVQEINELNILHASLLAMRKSVERLKIRPELVLIDGNQKIRGPWRQEVIVKGDLRCMPISAASVIAKTERDRFMAKLDEEYPGYQFGVHKGYATEFHREAIARLGPTDIHRRFFSGVKEYL